jgi:hypothetical protein
VNEFKITDPDAGTLKLATEPKLVRRGVCCVEVYNNGQTIAREEHEPDEGLERAVWPKEDERFIKLFERSKFEGEMVLELDRKLVATIRFCKHCKCLYVEKP